VNSDGSIQRGEKKTRLLAYDIALLARAYDIRLACASEIALPVPSEGVRILRSRIKKRTTYTMPNTVATLASTVEGAKKSFWKIDITEVESTSSNGASADGSEFSRSLEVEFEMFEESVREMASYRDTDSVRQFIVVAATELHSMISYLIPGEAEHQTHVNLQQVTEMSHPIYFQHVRDIVNNLRAVNNLPAAKYSRTEFIGSMPVNLCRSNLPQLHQNDYFVTEKSDGERYVLVVIADEKGSPLALLMNRKCELFKIPDGSVIGTALRVGTLLDGELVYNLSMRHQLFLVFDALADMGEPFVRRPFRDRIARVEGPIMQRLAAVYHHQQPQLMLVRKVFVPKVAIGELLNKLSMDETGSRQYMDGPRRHHRTDGIILQPDAPYVMSTDYALLKWKWEELRTVDLRVELNTNTYGNTSQGMMLTCVGPQGEPIECSRRTLFETFDMLRLLGDIRDSGSSGPSTNAATARIVEVTYNPQVGKWRYLHIRPDKAQANAIFIVMSVLMEQAEGISLEELEYTLLATSSGDLDYNEQLQRLSQQLLQARRENAARAAAERR
jgi:mRNA guanylyltransferase